MSDSRRPFADRVDIWQSYKDIPTDELGAFDFKMLQKYLTAGAYFTERNLENVSAWTAAHLCLTLPVERDHRQMRGVVAPDAPWELAIARGLLRAVMDIVFAAVRVDLKKPPPKQPQAAKKKGAAKRVEMEYYLYCRKRDVGREKPPLKQYHKLVMDEWEGLPLEEKQGFKNIWQAKFDAAYGQVHVAPKTRQPAAAAAPATSSQQIVSIKESECLRRRGARWFTEGKKPQFRDSSRDPVIQPEVSERYKLPGQENEATAARLLHDVIGGMAKDRNAVPAVVKWAAPRIILRAIAARCEARRLREVNTSKTHAQACRSFSLPTEFVVERQLLRLAMYPPARLCWPCFCVLV